MLYPAYWTSYELLDFGEGRKLERFGQLIVNRSEPSAVNKKSDPSIWRSATHRFEEDKGQKGVWDEEMAPFQIDYQIGNHKLFFQLKQTTFKHLGIFPEQAVNWQFIADQCVMFSESGIKPRVLNLFAYTGAASLIADQFGAEVTHVDSSKSVVNWARDNAGLNGISTIRWIVDDARKFVERSIKKEEKYNGIILDPPIFGMVTKGKNWKLNTDLKPLLEHIIQILDPENRFLILNTYSPQLPLHQLKKMLASIEGFPRDFEATTLGLKSSYRKELELGNLVRV